MKSARWILTLAAMMTFCLAMPTMAQKRGGKRPVVVGGDAGDATSTPTAQIGRYKATVTAIDTDGKTLKLKTLDGSKQSVVVVKETTPIIKNGKRIKLSDLKEGDPISIDVENKDGSACARSITVESSGKGGSSPKSPTEKAAPAKE